VSWKVDGSWKKPINPARDDFNRYLTTYNPTTLYRSRLDRTLYLRLNLRDSVLTDIITQQEFQPLMVYLYKYTIPQEADSIRVWVVNKKMEKFNTNIDSVSIEFVR
jgi:hypothetical protein